MANMQLMGSVRAGASLQGEVVSPEKVQVGGGTSNHAALVNRDLPDQHPIEAITGLGEAIAGLHEEADNKQPKGEYLTAEDIPEWAMSEEKPSYTAEEVNALPDTTKIPAALADLSEDATHRVVTDEQIEAWNNKPDEIPVKSVNGKTGDVKLNAEDVGALPAGTAIPDELGDLKGDASHRTVTDAQISAWNAKSEFSGEYSDLKNIPEAPVSSVNGKTGAVKLDAAAVGAHSDTWMPSAPQVGADPTGTATSAVSNHNTNKEAHNDIRLLIAELITKVTNFLNVSDTSRDQLSEVLALIDANAETLEDITTGKVNVSDIINNLTTNVSNKPLSAAQGVALKNLIDAIKVPTKVSELSNDANYAKKSEIPDALSDLSEDASHRTVTDTEKSAWNAKLNASDLGDAVDDALAQAKASGEFDGADGERGTGILKITTAPSSYTTATGGFTPTYRVALSTVKTQANVDKVLVGDTVAYNYYQYPVGYVDASYVYLGARTSVRGAAGTTPVKGTDYYTDADKAEMVTQVKAALPTLTVTGIDAGGTTHTWTIYGGKN